MIRPVTFKRIGLIPLLLSMAVLPWLAEATISSADSITDGLPPSKPKHPWKIFVGVPSVTNLAYLPHDVLPVARKQLEKDNWEIFIQDSAHCQLVTRWKPMHHALVWLFMGKLNARCTVNLERVGPNLTRMTFQADLASRKDLHDNPMIGRAERAYAKGARDYANEVRDYLDTHHSLSSLEPASEPSSVPAPGQTSMTLNRTVTRDRIER
jgi:hypothetical protein